MFILQITEPATYWLKGVSSIEEAKEQYYEKDICSLEEFEKTLIELDFSEMKDFLKEYAKPYKYPW